MTPWLFLLGVFMPFTLLYACMHATVVNRIHDCHRDAEVSDDEARLCEVAAHFDLGSDRRTWSGYWRQAAAFVPIGPVACRDTFMIYRYWSQCRLLRNKALPRHLLRALIRNAIPSTP